MGVDWNNFFTSLFGAGFGALTAFSFNIWRENIKQKQNGWRLEIPSNLEYRIL